MKLDFSADAAQQVTVIHLDKPIGTGKAISLKDGIEITGTYTWPPDAPAEIPFAFAMVLLSPKTCAIKVTWPGLLPKSIGSDQATYFMILLAGRPQFIINTPQGDGVNVAYMGPFEDPSVTTGIQVTAVDSGMSSSASLIFKFS